MIVGLLTEEQKNQLVGVEYIKDSYFNPIQDADGNWIISTEEIEQTEIEWVKKLPLIEYKPIEPNGVF